MMPGNKPLIRSLADQIEARVMEREPLTLEEMHQLAATLRVLANKHEPPATVLQFRRPEVVG